MERIAARSGNGPGNIWTDRVGRKSPRGSRLERLACAGAATLLAALVLSGSKGRSSEVAVLLARAVRDSMSASWTTYNQYWDQQVDRNTMERMLGTVGPTQREFLGCLQGRIVGDTIRIESSVAATDLKQLPLAVAGNCDGVTGLLGSWHTHPYRADLQNLPLKERRLSAQDLETFAGSSDKVTLVMWDVDSIDAAARWGGKIVHPVSVVVR